MPSPPDDLAQFLCGSEAQGLSPAQIETLAAFRYVHGPATEARYRAVAAAARESVEPQAHQLRIKSQA